MHHTRRWAFDPSIIRGQGLRLWRACGVVGALVRAACVVSSVVFPSLASPSVEDIPESNTLKTTQQALYLAVVQNQSSDAVSLLIKQQLDALARPCPQVSAYQIGLSGKDNRILKIKCIRHPLYSLTLKPDGGVHVQGGDGTIADLRPADGPIHTVLGETLSTYLAQEMVRNSVPRTLGVVMGVPPEKKPPAWANMRVIGIIVFDVIVLAALGWFGFWAWRNRRTQTTEFGGRLNSMDKDALLHESREIYPDVYRHPRGFVIARGRRGKRRLFRSAFLGVLYRDWGFKIGEIRE